MPRSWLARTVVALLGVLAAAACTPQRPTTEAAMRDKDTAAGPLVSSLQVESFPDSVHLTLQVTNVSEAPVTLNFTSGQSFDFAVHQDAQQLWTWSADKMFTAAIRTEQIAPGETQRYEGAWAPEPGLAGDFTAVGFLTAREHRAEQQARFRLP